MEGGRERCTAAFKIITVTKRFNGDMTKDSNNDNHNNST